MSVEWKGVFPAITTPFNEDLSIDHEFLAKHCNWLVDNGCKGIVPCGSLGEGATLTPQEKVKVVETCVKAVGDRVPIVPGVSSLSTAESVSFAKMAKEQGARGLMVLPAYVYSTDWREIKAHVSAIISATDLSCMLYNNPPAYKTDFTPECIAELASEHPNLECVKESSGDTRRVSGIRCLLGDRVNVFNGIDDAIVEGVNVGANGWIAGLVNAFPKESVALFEYAKNDQQEAAFELYQWFLPLLRLDTVPKLVQHIKLVQEAVGMGNPRVRPPRLELVGDELEDTKAVIKIALDNMPSAS